MSMTMKAQPPASEPPWRAALSYFGGVFALGFVLGVARTLFVEAGVSRLLGVALELPVMLAFSAWWCSRLLRQQAVPARVPARQQMGALAFALLMLAELLLSTLLAGRTLAEHLALYRQPSHQLGLAGQLVFGLMPLGLLGWDWVRPGRSC